MPPRAKLLIEPCAYVATHHDVREFLAEWSHDSNYRTFAARFQAMLQAFARGPLSSAEIILEQLRWDKIRGAKILEYGKRQKGGAPRIFGMRFRESHIFVAAAVEKQNTGCRNAIALAKSRASELERQLKNLTSSKAFRTIIGSSYECDPISPSDTP